MQPHAGLQKRYGDLEVNLTEVARRIECTDCSPAAVVVVMAEMDVGSACLYVTAQKLNMCCVLVVSASDFDPN